MPPSGGPTWPAGQPRAVHELLAGKTRSSHYGRSVAAQQKIDQDPSTLTIVAFALGLTGLVLTLVLPSRAWVLSVAVGVGVLVLARRAYSQRDRSKLLVATGVVACLTVGGGILGAQAAAKEADCADRWADMLNRRSGAGGAFGDYVADCSVPNQNG